MTTALILGATGLVGGELLDQLLDNPAYERVVVVTRRPTGKSHPKLDEQIFELGDMEKHADVFAVQRIFCALGTTIGKAGSQERFRIIDHDYALLAAKLGRSRGARHFLVVSALGASSRSSVFYNRVKGELEDALRSLVYPSLTIARPSLLLGSRDEFRFGESFAKVFAWLLPPRWRGIRARHVARALIELAREETRGARVVESKELRKIAKKAENSDPRG